MSLKVTEKSIWEEVRSAESFRDDHLDEISSRVQRYHGSAYKGSSAPGSSNNDPENHSFEWISQMVPLMADGNPKFNLASKRPGPSALVVDALERGLNRWTRDVSFKADAEVLAVDYSFAWFAAIVTLEPRPGMHQPEDPIMWPQVYRLGFKEFFLDPRAKRFEDARFMGHTFVRDIDDVIAEAEADPELGWDKEALKSLVPGEGVEEFHNGGEERDAQRGFGAPDRKEVLFKEVWVPEHELDDSPGSEEGFNGTILTLVMASTDNDKDGKPKFIRKARPFYGHRSGPYVLAGSYRVPDDPWPMSPLVAVSHQAQDVNNHARASKNSADNYKKLILVDNAMDRDLADKVKNTPDSFVVPIAGMDRNSISEVEIGGVTRTQVDYLGIARERLERNSGMSEAQYGATSGATATEVSVANNASKTRMSHITGKFEDGVRAIARKVSYYLFMDDEIIFPLGEADAAELQMQEPWFRGGSNSGFGFDDLEFDIEPYSMGKMTEAMLQQQVMQMTELATGIAPMIPQMPWVRWKVLLKELAESMRKPAIEHLIDVDMALKAGQAPPQSDPWTAVGVLKRQAGAARQQGPDPRVNPSGAFPRALQDPAGGMGDPSMGGGGPIPTDGNPMGGGTMALKGQMDRR
jgi:hypothetical protein